MSNGLYERDALAWAERQADLLCRLAAGECVNEEIDWLNVIEEVQDVGQSELRSCQISLRHAITHLLKLHAWPGSQAASHWREKAGEAIDDARMCFAPSMRQHIDIHERYRRALRLLRSVEDDSGEPHPVPDASPFALDDLLASETSIRTLVHKLGTA